MDAGFQPNDIHNDMANRANHDETTNISSGRSRTKMDTHMPTGVFAHSTQSVYCCDDPKDMRRYQITVNYG